MSNRVRFNEEPSYARASNQTDAGWLIKMLVNLKLASDEKSARFILTLFTVLMLLGLFLPYLFASDAPPPQPLPEGYYVDPDKAPPALNKPLYVSD